MVCSGCVLEWDRIWPSDGQVNDHKIEPDAPTPGSWAMAMGALDHAASSGVVVDSANNIYIAGQFKKGIPFKGITVETEGGFDLFVAKLSSAGKVLWITSGGGKGADISSGIVINPAGGVLVTGYFSKSMSLGGKPYAGTGVQDAYVAWIGPGGTVQRVKTFGGDGTVTIAEMAVDETSGALWITGKFSKKLKVGSSTFSATLWDIFLARLSVKDGSVQKTLQIGADSRLVPAAMALGSSGNVVLTGVFGEKKMDGKTIKLGGNTYTSRGKVDFFVTKIDANADKFLWAAAAGSTKHDEPRDLVLDTAGNVYLTGLTYGTMTLGSTKLTFSGGSDLFVAKMSAAGKFQWAISSKGTNQAEGTRVAMYNKDQLLMTGFYMGPDALGGKTLTHRGSRDIVLARLATNSGKVQGITSAGGSAMDHPLGITVGNNGMIHLTGLFQGSLHLCATTLEPKDYQDVFVWKLAAP